MGVRERNVVRVARALAEAEAQGETEGGPPLRVPALLRDAETQAVFLRSEGDGVLEAQWVAEIALLGVKLSPPREGVGAPVWEWEGEPLAVAAAAVSVPSADVEALPEAVPAPRKLADTEALADPEEERAFDLVNAALGAAVVVWMPEALLRGDDDALGDAQALRVGNGEKVGVGVKEPAGPDAVKETEGVAQWQGVGDTEGDLVGGSEPVSRVETLPLPEAETAPGWLDVGEAEAQRDVVAVRVPFAESEGDPESVPSKPPVTDALGLPVPDGEPTPRPSPPSPWDGVAVTLRERSGERVSEGDTEGDAEIEGERLGGTVPLPHALPLPVTSRGEGLCVPQEVGFGEDDMEQESVPVLLKDALGDGVRVACPVVVPPPTAAAENEGEDEIDAQRDANEDAEPLLEIEGEGLMDALLHSVVDGEVVLQPHGVGEAEGDSEAVLQDETHIVAEVQKEGLPLRVALPQLLVVVVGDVDAQDEDEKEPDWDPVADAVLLSVGQGEGLLVLRGDAEGDMVPRGDRDTLGDAEGDIVPRGDRDTLRVARTAVAETIATLPLGLGERLFNRDWVADNDGVVEAEGHPDVLTEKEGVLDGEGDHGALPLRATVSVGAERDGDSEPPDGDAEGVSPLLRVGVTEVLSHSEPLGEPQGVGDTVELGDAVGLAVVDGEDVLDAEKETLPLALGQLDARAGVGDADPVVVPVPNADAEPQGVTVPDRETALVAEAQPDPFCVGLPEAETRGEDVGEGDTVDVAASTVVLTVLVGE